VNSDDVKYCPRCGTFLTAAQRFGKERPLCANCGWIYFADPKVAVATFIEQGGRVLLVRRANDPFRGLWTLPAGFVDAGEDPARAAERECLEETGLIVRATGVREVLAGQEHPRGADFIIIYDAEVLSGELAAGDDADAAEWFDRQRLPPLAFDSTQAILRPA
jgi:ADP-ribose pyrophosphatase YjhB (NUDIX family)